MYTCIKEGKIILEKSIFYNTDGLCSDDKTDKTVVELYKGNFDLINDGVFYEIDNFLNRVYDFFRDEYFTQEEYYSPVIPQWLSTGGIDPETPIDKNTFAQWVQEDSSELYNKFLLINDIYFIVSSIQNRLIETKTLYCSFYKSLSEIESHGVSEFPKDTLIFTDSEKTIITYSYLENLIIKIYGVFDFITKLLVEKNTKYEDFSKYPILKSKDILYGNAKKYITENEYSNTIYDKQEDILTIINIRNEIVHNASYEYQNKVYLQLHDGKVVEKYIYKIDSTNGTIDSVKNRRRFYSKGIKINYELPVLYQSILQKIFNTLKVMFS